MKIFVLDGFLSEKEEHSFLKHTTIAYFPKEYDFVLQYICVQLSPRVILFFKEHDCVIWRFFVSLGQMC
jgi:hypothetical protein